MAAGFQIENDTLIRYYGTGEDAVVPDGVKIIGKGAFKACEGLYRVTIPNGVTLIEEEAFAECKNLVRVDLPGTVHTIGKEAFSYCPILERCDIPGSVASIGEGAFGGTGLKSVKIPGSVRTIGTYAFSSCRKLESVTVSEGVKEIGDRAFSHCQNLKSVTIPKSVKTIGNNAFNYCRDLAEVNIAGGVARIGEEAFCECTSLTSVALPDSVKEIGEAAFAICKNLTSFTVPPKVKIIRDRTFLNCPNLTSVVIPSGVKQIGASAFWYCTALASITIPDTVTQIGKEAFSISDVTIICGENSCAHAYCLENRISYVFDYQYKAFGGLLPQGYEMLASPFLADEEKPFIFISYSHKDRDRVLEIIKVLYEAGWKVWYDEGLTIGDKYDETLESHVENCAVFLLFVTQNSLNSFYVRENEIRWARDYGRPIIKCILEDDLDYDTEGGSVVATVKAGTIEPALKKVSGLTKGNKRTAKGISVIFNPADRQDEGGVSASGFAYCLYSRDSIDTAKTILLAAKNDGCVLYDAVENGFDEEKLRGSASLIFFLDKAFLADKQLTAVLTEAYRTGRDMAVCQLENIGDEDLPPELSGLSLVQWLNFVTGITSDMNTKLARHLQKRGCRNTAVLPGFEYEKTDRGIIIKKYTGMDPNPRIESEYGGVPVIEIADFAFQGCKRLENITIPYGVKRIGKDAFRECTGLTTVSIPGSVTTIEEYAFRDCFSLTSVDIPSSVTEVGPAAFINCKSMTSATVPESLNKITGLMFADCESLTSVNIPGSIKEIEACAFEGCKTLPLIRIPDSVKAIEKRAFDACYKLTVICSPLSYAARFCKENKLKHKSVLGAALFGISGKK